MRFSPFRQRMFGLALFTASSLSFPAAAQEAAGRVLMAIGEVSIKRGATLTPAKKGAEVMAGDAIITGGTSNAQVKFSDGAVIALRPNTEFKVNEYKFSGKADGSEAASLSLVKGGVRAVTGAIGRGNRDNLKVDAVVATVGIRGTGFNIVFCDAACLAASPTAKEGLYAGVFEGKIAVANRGGRTSDLGVNRFTYVSNENTAPQLLIAPPSFLKDSLEGQVRVRPKEITLNSASVNNTASTEKSVAAVKAPTNASDSTRVSADVVGKTVVAAALPDVQRTYPSQFFDSATGFGALPASGNVNSRLRGARFDPSVTSSATSPSISLNAALEIYTSTGDYQINSFSSSSGATTYSINSAYVREGGRSGVGSGTGGEQVIAWGRWSGASAVLGDYTRQTLELNQGFHYIYGVPATTLPAGVLAGGSVTMSVIGGTIPTELRSGALDGWRLTGGSVTLTSSQISGLLNLYLGRSEGYGNFDMTWSKTLSQIVSDATAGNLESLSTSVKRTSGNVNVCVSGCSGQAQFGLYGPVSTGQASHGGMSYIFNTGSYQVQGVAIFKAP